MCHISYVDISMDFCTFLPTTTVHALKPFFAIAIQLCLSEAQNFSAFFHIITFFKKNINNWKNLLSSHFFLKKIFFIEINCGHFPRLMSTPLLLPLVGTSFCSLTPTASCAAESSQRCATPTWPSRERPSGTLTGSLTWRGASSTPSGGTTRWRISPGPDRWAAEGRRRGQLWCCRCR